MRALAEAIVGFFGLLEAEGRELRRNIALLLVGAALFFVAAIIAAAGFLAVLAALFHFLLPRYGIAASYAAAGALSLAASLAFFTLVFGRLNKNPTGKDSGHEQQPPQGRRDARGDEGTASEDDGESGPLGSG